MTTTAVILLSHGSRLPEALTTLQLYKDMIEESGQFEIVEAASLQFNKPDLEDAVASAVARGAERLIVTPLFLYQGVHIQQDIPSIIEAQRKKYPAVEIVIAGNLGADKRVAEVLLDRIKEVS